MQKLKEQKGITLIALIITIIVMLILVGVSVTVALKGGLFTAAKNAANNTKLERDNELAISNGDIIYQHVSGTGNGSETGTEYTVGTEVTIGETGENFYVIKDEGTELVLLAKNNIEDNMAFEGNYGNYYWSSITDTSKYPLNLNEYGTCPEGCAIDIAKQYAEEITGSRDNGRLMTYEEALPLSESEDEEILKILYGTYSEGTCLKYWLGTASNTRDVWCVLGNLGGRVVDTSSYNGDFFGVRPVIEISESAVTIVP